MTTWMALRNLIRHHYQTKRMFYGLLNDKHISDEQQKHAQIVWETFKLNDG